jgi:hypothetical protein
VGYLELSLNKSLIHRFVNLGVGTTTVESSDFDASGGRFDGNGCSASGVKPDLQKIHPLHDVSELTAQILPDHSLQVLAFVTAAPKTPVAAISFRITLPSPIPCWPPVSDCRQ